MAHRLTAKRALLAKIESTYGTDPTPVGGTDAMYVYDLSITPMELVKAERNPVRPFFGADATILGGTPVKLEFKVPIAGGGAAATAPGDDCVLRACGHAKTVGADVTYSLIGAAYESATFYANVDGVLHKVTGARGSVSFDFSHGQVPMKAYSIVGIYSAPTDTALPTVTFGATWPKPLIMNKVNTTPVTLHGISVILTKLSIKPEQSVEWRDWVNSTEEVKIVNRPKVTMDVSIQADTLAAKDWFATAKAGTTGALTITHGTVAGNKAKIDAATVQLFDPSYEDDGGIVMIKMSGLLLPSATGNDEYTYKTL